MYEHNRFNAPRMAYSEIRVYQRSMILSCSGSL